MAIVGTRSFNVARIELTSLVLSRADGLGMIVRPRLRAGSTEAHQEDVASPFNGDLCDCQASEGDGVLDLSLKFDQPELSQAFLLGSATDRSFVILRVTGRLVDGTEFTASDCIWVINNEKPKARR